MDEREIRVDEPNVGVRIDRFLASLMPEHSRNQIQGWIRGGRVTVGGKTVRASYSLERDDLVRFRPPDAVLPTLEPLDFPVEIVHEDEHFLVLVKPVGLQVHPGAGPARPTLVQALLHRYPDWLPPGSADRPGIVHRLDRDTTGLMVVARTELGFQELGRQIRNREVSRRYIALLWGAPDSDSGEIDAPMGRDPHNRTKMAVVKSGRPAQTRWTALHRFEALTLVEVVLQTGRTHQIRVHFSSLGLPVFGDPVYGTDRIWIDRQPPSERPELLRLLRHLNRQALHAYHLTFRHPASDLMLRFEAPLPGDMDEVLVGLTTREKNG